MDGKPAWPISISAVIRAMFASQLNVSAIGMRSNAAGKRISRRKNQSHVDENTRIRPRPSMPEQARPTDTRKCGVEMIKCAVSADTPETKSDSAHVTEF